MKKIVSIVGIVILFLLAIIVLFPLAFKGKINEMVMKKTSSLEADISYDEYKLTMFSSFPDFTATFRNIAAVGQNDFKGDTLFALEKFSARIDLPSLLKGKGILVKTVEMNDGRLQLIENSNGNCNWNIKKIPKSLPEKAEKQLNKPTPFFKAFLNNVTINGFDVSYINQKSDYQVAVDGLTVGLSGTIEGLHTLLNVKLHAPDINFAYDSVRYVNDGEVTLKTQLDADLSQYRFSFVSGSSLINGRPVVVDGGFSMPGDSLSFNIKFDVANIEMKQLLNQLPKVYKKYMNQVEADGNILLNGTIKGIYYDDIYPAVNIDFKIHDGTVKYPQLPEKLIIDELEAKIEKPEGIRDLTTVEIPALNIHFGKNPLSLHAAFRSLFSDPYLDIALDGIIDMGSLSKVVPLGDSDIEGTLTTNASIKGYYSALANNDFSSFVSTGNVSLTDFFIANSAVPQGIRINNASFVLENQEIKVKGLRGKMGKSDFDVQGELKGFLTYLFAGKRLSGQFDLNSELLDLNEFLEAYHHPSKMVGNEAYTKADSSGTSKPFKIPANIKLNFNTTITRLLLDKMDITTLYGRLMLNRQKLKLKDLNMNMIGGHLKMSGTVLADGREYPDLDLNLDIAGFDLPTAYKQITMVQKYMPFAAKSQGNFSTVLNVQSKMDTNWNMVLSDLTAKGDFSTHNVKLVDADYLSNLKSVIQPDKLRNFELDDFKTSYSITNGNLKIEPFSTRFAGQPISLEGTYKLCGTIDLRVDATLEKKLLANNIQNMIAYIPGSQKIKKVDVGLNIEGDAQKPDVKVDMNKIKKQVIGQIKKSSPQELQDAAKKFLKDLF